MSALRRRLLGRGRFDDDDSEQPSRTPSPARAIKESDKEGAREDDSDDAVKVPRKKLEKLNSYVTLGSKQKGKRRGYGWVFGLGGLFGIVVAIFFVGHSDVLDITAFKDLNLDSLIDVLPSGLIKEARDLQKHEREAVAYDSFAVGLHAKSQGLQAHHPVIMIPGVISTGIESWGTEEESRPYFRKRLWGSWSMMRALILDKASWKRHIMLDKVTGLDPPGIKLRASQGFDAADFFITGYWIWNKIIENLATIGYDPSNAFTAAYDWRLAYGNLEHRDQYFSRLQAYIESAVRISDKKVVLLSHSMGAQVLYYFFHWVEAEGYGGGGPSWVDDHIESWINISGCMLGALKDVPAVLSGEMKDTAQLSAFAVYGLEKFLSRHERAEIFRAMFGISSMLPIGGDAVWGNGTWAPDDKPGQNISFGKFITFREPLERSEHTQNLTMDETMPYIFQHTDTWYKDAILSNYSFGVAHKREEVEANQLIPRRWMNPLETRLPLAPNLKIYCFYGFGKDTERAYFYKEDKDPATLTNVTIDVGYMSSMADHGVVMGEGDGTVSLLSTGYMCNKGWQMKRYNPAGVKIKIVEMPDEPDRFSPRGGPNTGDHVDILGRSSLNDLILKVAGGQGESIEEVVLSNIKEYSDKVKIWDDDEDEDGTLGERVGGSQPVHLLQGAGEIFDNIVDKLEDL